MSLKGDHGSGRAQNNASEGLHKRRKPVEVSHGPSLRSEQLVGSQQAEKSARVKLQP